MSLIYNPCTLNIMRALSGVPNLLMIIPTKPNAVMCLSLTLTNRIDNFLYDFRTQNKISKLRLKV